MRVCKRVLILVLVEDGLGAETRNTQLYELELCLNPCFSGGWSRSCEGYRDRLKRHVLILVLVEDGLGAINAGIMKIGVIGLNPCFSGGWSRSSIKK